MILQSLLFLLVSQIISPTILAMAIGAPKYFIGFDLGTSGARISIIEPVELPTNTGSTTSTTKEQQQQFHQLHSESILYSNYDHPNSWISTIQSLLQNTPQHLLQSTKAICVSGTSASCLISNSVTGEVRRKPKMYDYDITHESSSSKGDSKYDYDSCQKTLDLIDKYVPKDHVTRGSTSTLSKLLHYHYCEPLLENDVLVHQSEYVANTIFLSGIDETTCCNDDDFDTKKAPHRVYVSDWHNALKLGYDVRTLNYPSWLMDCLNEVKLNPKLLPNVVAPGEIIGTISSNVSKQFGIHPDAVVVGGTTDSNAAFVAATTGGDGSMPTYGTAVTSLGSTLAIKMLSRSYVENSSQGVYSHRFPIFGARRNENKSNDDDELWLVGGASNVGCAILRQEKFSNEELISLSQDMDVHIDSPLLYYPLTKRGERFPIANGSKEPIMSPKPESRAEYLKAILQGIALVEKQGFEVLGSLGADPSYPDVVSTCGGGSKNDAWIQMRQRILKERVDGSIADVKVIRASNSEASFGAAVLAASRFC